MRARCSNCSAVYRLDPKKVGSGTIRARCARCSEIIVVTSSAPIPPVVLAPVERESVKRESVDPQPVGFQGGASTHAEESASGVNVTGAEAAGDPLPFGSTDPDARARRLARALVSDIAVYHGDRRDRSLREGRLRQELGDEIRKSWQEYESQVGNQIARETSYFREALNEILARGEKLF